MTTTALRTALALCGVVFAEPGFEFTSPRDGVIYEAGIGGEILISGRIAGADELPNNAETFRAPAAARRAVREQRRTLRAAAHGGHRRLYLRADTPAGTRSRADKHGGDGGNRRYVDGALRGGARARLVARRRRASAAARQRQQDVRCGRAWDKVSLAASAPSTRRARVHPVDGRAYPPAPSSMCIFNSMRRRPHACAARVLRL